MKQLFQGQLPESVVALITSMAEEIKAINLKLEGMNGSMAISETDFNLLKERVSTIETTLTGINTTIGSLQTTDGTLTQDISDLNASGATLAKTVSDALMRITDMELKHLIMAVRDLQLDFADEDAQTDGIQVTQSIALPATDEYESAIAWSSSDPAVISDAGVVTRPAAGSANALVTLTATLTYGLQTQTKAFPVTVLAEPASTEPGSTV